MIIRQVDMVSGKETIALDPNFVSPPPTPEMVKEEASRRILEICPEWRQRNLTAQAVILAEKGRSNWTAQELTDWTDGEALWASIAAIRSASDVLEATPGGIPSDYKENKHWP